jgi:HEAT repeat protein
MHTLPLCLTLALMISSPTDVRIEKAFGTVANCEDLKAIQCLQATAALERQGDPAIKYITPRFGKMSALGQMLALSVYGAHPGREATMGLASLVLKTKLAPAIRSVAIQTLADRFDGKHTKRLVTATLIKAARDAQPTVRAAAVRALGNRANSADRHVISLLRRAATDTAPAVRTEAILGLGMTAREDVAGLLIGALKDPVARVRIASADGLSFVRSDDAVKPLIESLRSNDPLLRRVVSEALAFQTSVHFGDDYPLWREWWLNR